MIRLSRCALLLPLAAVVMAADGGIVLQGQLLDENGSAPLAGVDVFSDSVGTKVARTDAAGRFSYPVPAGAPVIHVLPWSREIVGRSVMIQVADFQDSTFRIVVERGVALAVRVQGPDGKPIPNAKVAWVGSGGASGETGSDGMALVGRISRFKNGKLVARVPGYPDASSAEDLCAATYADRVITLTVPGYQAQPEPIPPAGATTGDPKF